MDGIPVTSNVEQTLWVAELPPWNQVLLELQQQETSKLQRS